MDRDALDIELSQSDQRDLHHYGIEINSFSYASQRLATLRAMLPKKSKVDLKWPDDDAGHIWVWDPIANEYFAVPNKDPQYAGLTVEQAKRPVAPPRRASPKVLGASPQASTGVA